ncbi:alpha/beta hydrolase [Nocardioides sp.]|uniref:alpha/beta fold hydrolase n=1 Tax=Nocardioides sp. TaxID=35761 RepID=UPI001A2D36EB|nr:alpha/beta hydrolase [Nocardioides sp.]MBJ7356930.1 alpha/beta hydrolase [Nocardioides sp.]
MSGRTGAEPEVLELDLPEVTLSALAWGPAEGPLVVALHGFPDTAWTWRHLGPHLADLGWRVVAPHLRGYAPSGLPRDGSFHVGAIMADAVAVHERLGGDERAVLVGHDWGAIAANALNGHDDSPFGRAVTLAVPPMQAMAGFDARLMLRQARHSWYILFNQLPVLPERTQERLVRKLWRDWSPGYDAREDLGHVLAAVSAPDRRSAPFDYYRALTRPWTVPEAYRAWQATLDALPTHPLLYLHGADDGCLDVGYAAKAADGLPDLAEVVVVPGAGHFLQLEQPDAVNAAIADFLAR